MPNHVYAFILIALYSNNKKQNLAKKCFPQTVRPIFNKKLNVLYACHSYAIHSIIKYIFFPNRSKFSMNLSKRTIPTYIKYVSSYVIILAILILGFYFIIRTQLTEKIFNQRISSVEIQLDNFSKQLNDDLIFLSQLDSALQNNEELRMHRYNTEGEYKRQAFQELKQYSSSSKLVRNIVYAQKNSDWVLSTQLVIYWQNGVFYITSEDGEVLTFDPAPYLDEPSGSLIFLSGNTQQYLLYFPAISSKANYIFFYELDTTDIQFRLKNILANEITAIAFINSNREIISAENEAQIKPYLNLVTLKNGVYKPDDSTSICVHAGISKDFSLLAVLSNDFLYNQVDNAFVSTYLSLMLLSALGFLLVMFAMRITYLPLYKLTQKVIPMADSKRSYINQLDQAFTDVSYENQLLIDKLENYRISIQKSLFEDIVVSQQAGELYPLPTLDHFFDGKSNKTFFIIKITASTGILCYSVMETAFHGLLSDKDTFIMLENNEHTAAFLITLIDANMNKESEFQKLLHYFHEEYGYLSAISNTSDSALDIPSLYENLAQACSRWPQIPVVDFQSLPLSSSAQAYPHDKLNALSDSLKSNNFCLARALIDELFQTADTYSQNEHSLPVFFVRSLLIDILTTISNCINQSNISFSNYGELFYTTLYLCRSCSYSEKSLEIVASTHNLIDFYEAELADRLINAAPLRQLVEENYCQPDFSIARLANHFHVSVAYMSQLFKTELNIGFADYLWMLRLEKAKELLMTTDMSIDDISIAVGYYNTSSFRRKFKQKTGLSPSQFRNNH